MTTKILIINDPDSNSAQHAVVTVEGDGIQTTTKRLAPGETFSRWITDRMRVSVTEVFEPKPKE